MLKCQVIMDAMERIAPKKLAEDWDNPGLLVGSPADKVEKILVCLDVSDEVIDKAIKEKADMIISHHPLIFRAIKNFRTDLPLGRKIQKLLVNNIKVLAAHTNLDIAVGGVNDMLAEKIGLKDVKAFVMTNPESGDSMGRIGYYAEPLTAEAFAQKVKEALPTDHVRLVKAGGKLIRKVALCSGAGAEFIAKAAFMGADAYLTGDVKYHDAQRAVEEGIHVVDAGHYPTEFPIVDVLAKRLGEELAKAKGSVEIIKDDVSKDFFTIIE